MKNNIIKLNNCMILAKTFDQNSLLRFISDFCLENKIANREIASILQAREDQSSTGFEHGIAIPHCRSPYIEQTSVLLIKLKQAIDWNVLDRQKTNLFFVLLVAEKEQGDYIDILGMISSLLLDQNFILTLNKSTSPVDLFQIFQQRLQDSKQQQSTMMENDKPFYVAIIACTYGLAHTYLAEQRLITIAKKMNINLKIETYGVKGNLNKITEEDLAQAKGVLIAVDKELDLSYVKHNNIVYQRTIDVVKKPEKGLNELINNQGQNNWIKFKINSYRYSSYASSKAFNYLHIFSILFGILIYLKITIPSLQNNIFINTNLLIFQCASIIAPCLFGMLLSYLILNRNELVAGLIGAIIIGYSIYYVIFQQQGGIGIFGAVVITIAFSYLYKFLLYFDHFLFKKHDLLFNGFKFFLKLLLGFSLLIIMYFGMDYFIISDKWIFDNFYYYNNRYWWFRWIIAFLFLVGMVWDLGGPINKWTLMFSGIIFYNSIARLNGLAQNLTQIYFIITPLTATTLAISLPPACAWMRGIYGFKLLDDNEKKAWKEAYVGMLRCISEKFYFYKIHYKVRSQVANWLTCLFLAFLIAFFNLQFFGGFGNILGAVFGFSMSDYFGFGNITFLIVILATLIVGGFIHLICYWPQANLQQGEGRN
ncbi:PTS sugar transporter subunit IIA [Spiroplasma sp. SV19]|uniref:PTS sugar transporter subunit IIA n=1 Tax=Spiroplasma sp. SV19 TaxID=2570468 RepID=UPI0024B7C127|nr:PTS sugar transporter subunit IIA [Spiroplasma sp. SV19]WHQ36560.1 hypothetical protein E7Y35_01260 [Spiroplasma sp. SV19]